MASFSEKVISSGAESYNFLSGTWLRRKLGNNHKRRFDAAAVQGAPVAYENDYGPEDILAADDGDIESKDLHANYMFRKWSARENSFRAAKSLGGSVVINKFKRFGRLTRKIIPVAALAADNVGGGERVSYLSTNLNLLKLSAVNYGAYLL